MTKSTRTIRKRANNVTSSVISRRFRHFLSGTGLRDTTALYLTYGMSSMTRNVTYSASRACRPPLRI